MDADACPRPAKELLFRLAEKRHIELTLVANQYLKTPPSRYIRALQVPGGFDVADNEIVARLNAGDIVITADVPLADEVIQLDAVAINPRGTIYTPANIKDHLARRDLLAELRDQGTVGSGQDAYGPKDLQAFANAIDKTVTRLHRPA